MHDELTREDIRKMQEELDYRRLELHPGILEEVKRTRAFGDLSENYEYKAAKQAQRENVSRMRYLEGMIKSARVISDRSGRVVTTVRCDPRKGLISKESPFGQAVLGRRVGDHITVQVSETYSYEAVIKSIVKDSDDGSVPLMGY